MSINKNARVQKQQQQQLHSAFRMQCMFIGNVLWHNIYSTFSVVFEVCVRTCCFFFSRLSETKHRGSRFWPQRKISLSFANVWYCIIWYYAALSFFFRVTKREPKTRRKKFIFKQLECSFSGCVCVCVSVSFCFEWFNSMDLIRGIEYMISFLRFFFLFISSFFVHDTPHKEKVRKKGTKMEEKKNAVDVLMKQKKRNKYVNKHTPKGNWYVVSRNENDSSQCCVWVHLISTVFRMHFLRCKKKIT